MDITRQKERLLANLAFLPGSRDVWGGPLLVVLPPPSLSTASINVSSTSTTSIPSVLVAGSVSGDGVASGSAGAPLGYSDLVSLIGYLSSIPPPDAITRGFTVLIDGRRAPPKAVRAVLRACNQALYKKVRQAIIVQPEKFLDQQKVNLELLREAFSFKTPCVSVHKLSKLVHITQLPEVFGGTYTYDALEWVDERERFEKTRRQLEVGMISAKNSGGPLSEAHAQLLKHSEALANELATRSSASEEQIAAALQLRSLVSQTKEIVNRPDQEAAEATRVQQKAQKEKMVEEHTAGCTRVLDWLEGPGERWLLTLHEIGESRDEAKQLVKEHQQLHSRAQELVKQTDELGELATKLSVLLPTHASTLEKSRLQLSEMVARFVSRVERGQEMAERSDNFHHLMSQFSRKADVLLDGLCTEKRLADLAGAESQRTAVEKSVTELQEAYDDLSSTGKLFVEDLAANEINPLGPRPARDYSAAIAHTRQLLASANERRRRCVDLVEVRLLKLQQTVQLLTCERDAEQAVDWLREMHDTLLKHYSQVNFDMKEVATLREDQAKLEETAQSTYEYGKQLCQAALVLRRSLRMPPQRTSEEKLEQTCGHLCRALSDNEAKLSLTEAFLDTLHHVNERMEHVERRGRAAGEKRPAKPYFLAAERRAIHEDIRQLTHMAHIILSHLNANQQLSAESREEISKRLRGELEAVEGRQRLLESLFQQ